jgi:hypothetical protein
MAAHADIAPDDRGSVDAPGDSVLTTGPLPRLTRRGAIRAGVTLAAGGGLATGLAGLSTLGATSPSGPETTGQSTRQDSATPEPLPPPSAGSRTATLAEELRNAEFDEGHVRYLIEALARSGVATYADASGGELLREVRAPVSPMALTRWQVRNLARELATGAGQRGADLDGHLPVAEGMPPTSSLLAGYVATADTLGGAFCRGLLAEQDLTRPLDVVFPGAVFVLFASELAVEASGGVADGAIPVNARRSIVLPPAQGVCSDVETFISGTLEAVFAALKVEVPDDVPGAILASIWNFAVAIAEGIVTGLADVLTGPVIQVIRAIAGAVALVSQVLSFVTPWFVNASPSFANTRFAVGGEAEIAGAITFTIESGGLDEWPADVADCAKVAGAPLPALTPEPGTPVTFQLVESPIDLVAEGEVPTALDGNRRAVLQYVTNREDSDDGPVQSGTFLVKFTMEREGLEGLGQVLAGVLLAALPPVVTQPLSQLLGAQIDALVQTLDTLTEVVGTSLITVTYHEQTDPTVTVEAVTPEGSGGPACPAGEWTALNTQEFLQSILAPADILVESVDGVLTYEFAPGGALLIDPALLIICTSELTGGSGTLAIVITMLGPVTGTWEETGGALRLRTDASALAVTYEAAIDGMSIGGQTLELGLGEIFNGGTYPYECGDGTMSLTADIGSVPLVLGR